MNRERIQVGRGKDKKNQMMAFKVVSFSKEETKIPEIQEKYSELGRSSGRRLACARLHSILTPKKREKGRE